MDKDEFSRFWANRPRFDPFAPSGSGAIAWCEESKPFADWCLRLVATVANDPIAAKIAYAKVKLLDFYARAHAKACADHRAETNLDNHPCLHLVLLTAWSELENIDLRRGVPELSLPSPLPYLPSGQLDPDQADREYAEEVTGIVIGQGDANEAR